MSIPIPHVGRPKLDLSPKFLGQLPKKESERLMRTYFRTVLCCILLAFQVDAVWGVELQGGQQSPAANKQPVLEDGTPIKLRISQTVSSADAQVDDRVEFEVLEELKVGDVVVIPKGGIALGTVTEGQAKRRMGRGGKLEIVMDSVRLADGEKAALRATKTAQGGGHTGAMTAGIVVTGLLFWPAAPFFLFMHGKDITIPKGTLVPTFISGNVPLDFAKFQPLLPAPMQPQGTPTSAQAMPQQPSSAQPPVEAQQIKEVKLSESPSPTTAANTLPPQQLEPSTLVIKSTPDGADITIDGKFVGSTPSTVRLSTGDHDVSVQKAGSNVRSVAGGEITVPAYKVWKRNLTVSSGNTITIDATLEKTE